MTPIEFDAACRGFCRRRPFRAFILEFTSGNQMVISHPEAVYDAGVYYVERRPDGGFVVFSAESLSRLLDIPPKAAAT